MEESQEFGEGSFFTRFNEAVEECQRLQAQCRAAAEAAPKTEDSVDLQDTRRSVRAAKDTASYAKSTICEDPAKSPQEKPLSPRAPTPEFLKHLSDPPRESVSPVLGSADGKATETVGELAASREGQGSESDEAGAGAIGGGPQQPNSPALGEEAAGKAGNAGDAAEEAQPENDASQEGSQAEAEQNEEGEASGARRSIKDATTTNSQASALEGSGKQSRSSSKDKTSELGEDEDEEDEFQDQGRKWRARPPALRFKTRMMFSARFRPSEAKMIFEDANADLREKVGAKHDEIKDPLVGWVNTVFALSINTEYEFVIAFPLLVLTVLDAVYPKRVRWEKIDWRIQYKRALMRNYREVELLWQEVNMEKSREFRFDMTALRVEQLFTASLEEKLMFLRLLKRWFDSRIHHCPPYDPIRKRAEFADACRLRGLPVTFPSWMKVDKELEGKIAKGKKSGRYRELPEYMRLICFLGSPEHQTM